MQKFLTLLLFSVILSLNTYAQTNYTELDSIWMSYYDKGLYDKAIPFIEKGRSIAKKENSALRDSIYAEYTASLAIVLKKAGRLSEAEPLYLEAIELQKKILGAEHPDYAGSLNNLAELYRSMGRYEAAEPLYLQANAIMKKSLGEDHTGYATGLNNLAILYQDMGRNEPAEPLYLEANAIVKKALGEDHPQYAQSLNNLAYLYEKTERLDKAEPLYLEAKKIRKETLGPEHPYYASSLNNLGLFYVRQGRYTDAEPLFLEALKIRKKVLGEDHPEYATSLNHLATLYQSTNRYKEAEKLYLAAAQIRKEVFGSESSDYAASLSSLSVLFLQAQQLDSAFAYCVAAFDANSPDIQATMPSFDQLDRFEYYNNERAVKLMQTLLDIKKALYHQDKSPALLAEYYSIGKAAMRLNERIRNGFTEGDAKLRILKLNSFFVEESIAAVLELKQTAYYNEAFEFAEQNKSILLADALKGQRARSLGDLPDSLAYKELALQQKKDKLKKLSLEAKSEEDKSAIQKETNELNLEVDVFLKSIKEKYPKYHQLKYENITAKAAEIQKMLTNKNLLLEYFVSDEQVYLFCLSKEKLELLALPLRRDTLNKQVKHLRRALSDYDFINEQEDEAYALYTQKAYWFYEKLLAPALVNKKGIEQLIIISDGELGHLPFEAFLTEKAPSQKTPYQNLAYLLQKYSISYNYSATLWKENLSSSKRKNNGKMLAAAATYNSPLEEQSANRNPSQTALRKALKTLPAAEQEIKALQQLFRGAFWQDTMTNEHNFKAKASEYSIIHLSMHGLLNPSFPILSSLVFTENTDSLEDNFLQTFEIAHLKLNADLVVLSACETGYGKFSQGEGVMSIARSFMYAGVPALVVSLWQVKDISTSIIMQNFYKNLAKGMDKAEALRVAKLDFINWIAKEDPIGAHPAFWAPFVQLGDSRPISVAVNRPFMAYLPWIIGGLLAAAGLGIYALRRKRAA